MGSYKIKYMKASKRVAAAVSLLLAPALAG